jgi:two-component system, chemotaxis family, chemotaxis protein CheY
MTVLLIDDDAVSLRMLALTVGRLGLTSATATTGAAGLAWLADHPECLLIVTDLSMPGMSGLDVFVAVRDDPRFAGIPFLVCTGSADAATVREAIAQGVRHYIVKPIKPSVVAAKVTELVAKRAAEIAPVVEAAAPVPLPPVDPVPDAAEASSDAARAGDPAEVPTDAPVAEVDPPQAVPSSEAEAA